MQSLPQAPESITPSARQTPFSYTLHLATILNYMYYTSFELFCQVFSRFRFICHSQMLQAQSSPIKQFYFRIAYKLFVKCANPSFMDLYISSSGAVNLRRDSPEASSSTRTAPRVISFIFFIIEFHSSISYALKTADDYSLRVTFSIFSAKKAS